MAALLEVKDLKTYFTTRDGVVKAVDGVSFVLEEGHTLGIVGESGSGKSVTALSLMRLIPDPPGKICGGAILMNGESVLEMSDEQVRSLRGDRIAMIFQDPMTSLNPVFRVGHQIAEALRLHKGMDKKAADKRAAEMLELVGIPNPEDRAKDYPHQFSGGMRQRVMIAMALSCNPALLIADEPTTALDVTIQAQIIDLVKQLRDQFGQALIWITHDLGVVAGLAERVVVMYSGFIVEEANVEAIYENPQHPYTLALLEALPRVDRRRDKRLKSIPGAPPNLLVAPHGCPFAPRCEYAFDRCREENPPLLPLSPVHKLACWVDVSTGKPR